MRGRQNQHWLGQIRLLISSGWQADEADIDETRVRDGDASRRPQRATRRPVRLTEGMPEATLSLDSMYHANTLCKAL